MIQAAIYPTPKDYKSEVKPIWCPGCGDFGVLYAAMRALAQLKLSAEQTVIVSGLGCSGRFPHFVKTFGLHGIHGRALPLAQGVKMSRPDLTVFALGGDGDFFSIGVGHLIHAILRNIDITVIVMDNEIYGRTRGQASPTSPKGHITDSTPYGQQVSQFNPIATVLSLNASFVARGYSAKPKDLTVLIEQAVKHKGFSFVHVLSPCPTFNNTFDAWDMLATPIPIDHSTSNRTQALMLAMETERQFVGIFYQDERPTMDQEARKLSQQARTFNIEHYVKRYM